MTKFWLATIDGMPCESFNDRKNAVRWFKDVLKQVLKDFDTQDETDKYDYNIEFRKIEIKCFDKRETYLGA